MSVLVRKTKCKTCPFRLPNAEVEFAGAIKRASKSYLRCHETDEDGLKEESIQCRGFFDGNYGATTKMQREYGLFQFVDAKWYRQMKERWARRRK